MPKQRQSLIDALRSGVEQSIRADKRRKERRERKEMNAMLERMSRRWHEWYDVPQNPSTKTQQEKENT